MTARRQLIFTDEEVQVPVVQAPVVQAPVVQAPVVEGPLQNLSEPTLSSLEVLSEAASLASFLEFVFTR